MSLTKRPHLRLEALDDRIVPAAVDLTTFGTMGTVNGAFVHRLDSAWATANGDQSHGVGQLRTVLTVQNNGTEQGYNTNARPVQFNESTAADETRALRVDRVPVVTVGSTQYYEFVLNANETGGAQARNLSVDELRFYVSDKGNLKNYNATTKTLGLNQNMVSPLFDMGAGNSLSVRAKTNTNAVGEIAVLVPVSNFNGAAGDSFVYIYSKMSGANGGAEEWGVRKDPPVSPPPPPVDLPVTLSGHVFRDTNGDGIFNTGEGLSGITITFSGLDTNGQNPFEVDPTVSTMVGADGAFSFTAPSGGSYNIAITGNITEFVAIEDVFGDADGNGSNEDAVDGHGNGENFDGIFDIGLTGGTNVDGYGFIFGFPQGG